MPDTFRRPLHRRALSFGLGLAVMAGGLVAAPAAQAADSRPPSVPQVSVARWLPPKPDDFAGLYAWRAHASWTARDDHGVVGYQVQSKASIEGEALTPYDTTGWRPASFRSVSQSLYTGGQFCVRVRAKDAAGNVSAWSARHCSYSPIDTWPDFDGVAGGHFRDAADGHEMGVVSTELTGPWRTSRTYTDVRKVRMKVYKSPTAGSMRVYLGSHYLGTVNARGDERAWTAVTVGGSNAPLDGKLRLVPVTQKPVKFRHSWIIH